VERGESSSFSIYTVNTKHWLGTFFFNRFGSVRFNRFLHYKTENRTGIFSNYSNRFNRFFFSVRFFRLIFFRFSRFIRFSGFFAHPYVWLQFGRGEVGWERRRRRNRGRECRQMGAYNGFFRQNHRRIHSVGEIATSLYGYLSLNPSVISVGKIA